ncbi:MAG: hypothetical protein EX269_00750 [Acidimicrobiales bacterium]|nr:MAG: hypothetical protein EX269_00750 [Acidimicrobiales bacterium]
MGRIVSVNESGLESRRLAIDALVRIDEDGAYANLVLSKILDESTLETRDRGFVTELVYGTTRMRRALDYVVDRFIVRDDIEARVRACLRTGAYQLVFLGTPAHAAVDATVAATPKRARGFVNAILRKVAASGAVEWPTDAIRLSYPNWMIDRLAADLGDRAVPVLEAMNSPAVVHTRSDGYRQDPASQAVAELVDSGAGRFVLDLCAAPGGKATHIAGRGATVIGMDLHAHRAGLIADAAELTGTTTLAVVGDGLAPPFPEQSFDAVLVDAPCSGLGSLRRRADARWRMQVGSVDTLATLQFDLLASAGALVKRGGQVVFSTCTLTDAESVEIDDRAVAEIADLEIVPMEEWAGDVAWEPHGRGGRLLPDIFAGDGMSAFVYRRR